MSDATPEPAATDPRREMARQAATLFERLEPTSRSPGGAPAVTAEARDVVAQWQRAFSPDAPDAFHRRLGWDGLDEQRVLQALSVPAPPAGSAWISWIDRYLAQAARGADRGARIEGLYADDPAAWPPFAELLLPALEAAEHDLAERLPSSAADLLEPPARAALARHLLADLSAHSELAMLQAFRARGGSYAAFVADLLGGGLERLLRTYPVMARQMATVLDGWSDGCVELLERFERDRAEIATVFGDGRDPGRIAGIVPGLSDPHHGRRRVAALTFTGGLRLAYKPRDVGIEAAFARFVERLAGLGLDPVPPVPAWLSRPGPPAYGWASWIEPEPLEGLEAAASWYRSAGALLCLAHALRGRDLHMDNLVATARGPVVIDLEMLLQPVTEQERTAAAARHGHDGVAASCLSTGLLSDLQTAADGTLFDVGGLRGTGGGRLPMARRIWYGQGTDSVGFREEPTFMTAALNRPVVRGGGVASGPVGPDGFAAAMLDGFERAYRCLLARQADVLDPGGALEALAGQWARVIGRPTDQYAAFIQLLSTPRYQQSGALRGAALDAMNRPFSTAPARPPLWDLASGERRALERLDVPVFRVRTDGTGVYADGREVRADHFAATGLDAVRSRVVSLSEEDLRGQLTVLRRALRESLASRFETALPVPPAPAGASDPPAPALAAAHALWIASECLAREEDIGHGDVRAYDLYDGRLGPALFHAAVAATTGHERARVAVAAALEGLDRAWAARPDPGSDFIGACSGLGSLVYALVCIARLLDDRHATDLAVRVADAITPERIGHDSRLDVSHGSAGAILALLALHVHTGDSRRLDQAALCGEHLEAAGEDLNGAIAWRAADGRYYTGFAHGAAGIGLALVRLSRATGRQDFLRTAAGAHVFERRLLSPRAGNWPMAGGPDDPDRGMMTAWCHGAPGIALARVLAAVALRDRALLGGVEAALRTTAAVPVSLDDHLCCGSLGRADVLLTAGERLGVRSAVQAAWRIAEAVLARAAGERRYRLTSRGYDLRVFDTGFFRGLSGIGYQVLRLAAPDRLPSVLAFDLPPAPERKH